MAPTSSTYDTTQHEHEHQHQHGRGRGRRTGRVDPIKVGEQWLTEWTQAVTDWWDPATGALAPMWRAWQLPAARAKDCACSGGTADCGCGDAKGGGCCDPCACCLPEADIVVHTRVGETRVVSFEVRNERHRDRAVSVEVGSWTACDGPAVDVGGRVDPAALTLGPCEKSLVRLFLTIGVAGSDQGKLAAGSDQGRVPLDVASCSTVYADVRFDNCARPVRVAVAVHPAGCDAYDLTCGCGCC